MNTKTALKVAKQVSKQKRPKTVEEMALLALSNAYLKKLLVIHQYEKLAKKNQEFMDKL